MLKIKQPPLRQRNGGKNKVTIENLLSPAKHDG
jgi:hypothetical protein